MIEKINELVRGVFFQWLSYVAWFSWLDPSRDIWRYSVKVGESTFQFFLAQQWRKEAANENIKNKHITFATVQIQRVEVKLLLLYLIVFFSSNFRSGVMGGRLWQGRISWGLYACNPLCRLDQREFKGRVLLQVLVAQSWLKLLKYWLEKEKTLGLGVLETIIPDEDDYLIYKIRLYRMQQIL